MINSLDLPPNNQSKLELAKRKRKSWKGVTSIRKSARLNKNSVPLVIEIKLLDEESYHGDFEDNDNLSEICTKIIDDESYHGDSEDNESPKEEVLENINHPLDNECQLTLYHSRKSNDLDLTEEKLRLVQKLIRCPGTFYEFSKDPTIAYSLNTIYDFMITNNCRLPVGASIFEKPSMISIAPYQYRITRSLRKQEMDRLRPIFVMEIHVNFCTLYSRRNDFDPKSVKIGIYQLVSSIIPKGYCNNTEPIIQEVSYEQLDEEVVHFDDESGSESKVELEANHKAQELINRYPYWSDREKEIKEIEIKKIISTRSYQQA